MQAGNDLLTPCTCIPGRASKRGPSRRQGPREWRSRLQLLGVLRLFGQFQFSLGFWFLPPCASARCALPFLILWQMKLVLESIMGAKTSGELGNWDGGILAAPWCPAQKSPWFNARSTAGTWREEMLPRGFWHPNPVRIHQTRDLTALPLSHAKAPRQEGINVETDEKVLIPRPGCGAGRRRGASPA